MDYATLRKRVKGAKFSRLVWLGLTLTIFGFLEANFRTIEFLIPEHWRGPAVMAVGMLVVVLRFMTTLPLEDMLDDDPPAEDSKDA
jgi:hypothetical protein